MADVRRKVSIFHIVIWESRVVVRAGVWAVRAVRAGCCVASAGVPLFGLGVVLPVQESLCLLQGDGGGVQMADV